MTHFWNKHTRYSTLKMSGENMTPNSDLRTDAWKHPFQKLIFSSSKTQTPLSVLLNNLKYYMCAGT